VSSFAFKNLVRLNIKIATEHSRLAQLHMNFLLPKSEGIDMCPKNGKKERKKT